MSLIKKLFSLGILLPCFVSTSDWTGTNGNWNNAGNWSAGVPNAADAVANFPAPAASRAITLDISPTVGFLTATGGAASYSFSPSTSTIHFDGAAPVFTVTNYPSSFNCKFSIDSSTTFTTNSGINISGGISGSGDFTKSGTGSIVMSGTPCSYTGATNLTSGSLVFTTSNILPSTTDLTITGGSLNLTTNNLTIGSLAGTGGSISMSGSPVSTPTLT